MPATHTVASDLVIAELVAHDQNDEAFARRLTASFVCAADNARKPVEDGGLDPDLYALLDWPTTLTGYYAFLNDFARWVPNQTGAPGWEAPGTSQYQEVYDRLCHFYYLIDQPGPDGKVVQSDPWFAKWLDRYADAWGSFLDTPGSFTEADLASYLHHSPQYRVQDSMVGEPPTWVPNNPSGWNTFNQFFARELNPGLRPITDPTDNATVTSPADCTFHAQYPIDADSNVLVPDDGARLKGTHAIGNVTDLLEGSAYADAFAGGTFAHYFLAPYSYHRFHTPVAGAVLECYAVKGLAYLAVDIADDGQFDAPDDSTDGYEFKQARGVVVIDTAGSPYGDVGLVAVVPVGMAQVSSVHMTGLSKQSAAAQPARLRDPNVPEPWHYAKGEEFGYFLFGGSDIILLFQEGALESLDTATTYRYYGQESARCALRG